jgi:hypothetical protein
MSLPYFAYGSNLCLPRLRHRVRAAEPVGPAVLRGHVLRWHKRGRDGSGKCTIEPCADESMVVRGALFRLPESALAMLDRIEGVGRGYRVATVSVSVTVGAGVGVGAGVEGVRGTGAGTVSARTYVAEPDFVEPSLRPFAWYRDLVAFGAEAHGSPAEYVATVRQVLAIEDADVERARIERGFMRAEWPSSGRR